MSTSLSINNKQLFALLNGIIKRIFYNDSAMTTEFLMQNIFPELQTTVDEVNQVIAHYSAIFQAAAAKAMTPADLSTYLSSTHNITDDEVLAVWVKLWKSEHTKIHDKIVHSSKRTTTYDHMEWRVDTLSTMGHGMMQPVALVNLHTHNKEDKPSTLQFELDTTGLQSLMASVEDIDKKLEQFS